MVELAAARQKRQGAPGSVLGMAKGEGERLVVAMSGGVDSSVAAAVLTEAGYEVIGVTMNLSGGTSRCCSLEDADDARRVAERLGIRFYVANYTEQFRREVMETFADSYLKGLTPIPCVTCNKRFKFDYLMERASVFGASGVATGHYARVSQCPKSELFELRRPRDLKKDQTYFLFQLDQDQLASSFFPLGELTKGEVRERARVLGLETAEKSESQEICFVPDGDYAKVVEEIRPGAVARRGPILDENGKILGEHAGVHRFTIGQRHGLGVSSDRKLYVQRIDAPNARVIVAGAADIMSDRMHVNSVNWVSGRVPSEEIRARVQIRYKHEGAWATVWPRGAEQAEVLFDAPVRAVTPGQAAVFYDDAGNFSDRGERVLGGGWVSPGALA